MVPGLAVGLIALNMLCDANARVKAYTSEITANGFKLHLDSWADTKLYGAGCAWLMIQAADLDFQYGTYYTLEDHDWDQYPLHNTRTVTFKRSYPTTPKVVDGFVTSTSATRNCGASRPSRPISHRLDSRCILTVGRIPDSSARWRHGSRILRIDQVWPPCRTHARRFSRGSITVRLSHSRPCLTTRRDCSWQLMRWKWSMSGICRWK